MLSGAIVAIKRSRPGPVTAFLSSVLVTASRHTCASDGRRLPPASFFRSSPQEERGWRRTAGSSRRHRRGGGRQQHSHHALDTSSGRCTRSFPLGPPKLSFSFFSSIFGLGGMNSPCAAGFQRGSHNVIQAARVRGRRGRRRGTQSVSAGGRRADLRPLFFFFDFCWLMKSRQLATRFSRCSSLSHSFCARCCSRISASASCEDGAAGARGATTVTAGRTTKQWARDAAALCALGMDRPRSPAGRRGPFRSWTRAPPPP